MGRKLESKADEIKNILSNVRVHVKSIREGIQTSLVPDVLEEYGIYVYYIGLGMSCLVLLVLSCHILGKEKKRYRISTNSFRGNWKLFFFWFCKILKNFFIVFALIILLCNENLNSMSFLTRARKLFKGGNYSQKYGT